ncbi:hypothetical protein [Aeromicrobium endophyticum]|uniref:WD40 repeat domain-containing protein n=1 Tax=Aeromicrobium endophyticum TaxID=2292704 RepID=A0A371P2I4_9ACTN|nr:hypothetical protein [Aeromicrobium endophyticum]REK70157.1 hypothetical protein DX116_13405 [Aeromicrobium endophyticum]
MTDQLLEKIRDHAGAEPVPEIDLDGIIRRGRRVRRRRTVARRGIVTLAVGAIAGAVVVTGIDHGGPTRLDASTTISAGDVDLVSAAYRAGGAFSRGDTLWFSDPTYSVDLGVTVQMMLYTSQGVVAGVTNSDDGTARRDYVYVGTDGSVRPLDLPGKVVPGTDAQADRLVYLTKEGPGWRIHVVEASTGREVASVTYAARYTWAGWDVPPIGLTGDFVVLGVDGDQQVVNWRTGERVADVPGTQLPAVGGGRALGGPLSDKTYQLGDSKKLRSTTDLAVRMEGSSEPYARNSLSPDGRFVETTNTFVGLDKPGGPVTGVSDGVTGETVADPVVHVTDVATGRRITLPGHALTYGWTPDGRLMRVDGTKVTTCDASTGECTSTSVPAGRGAIRMAGRYLGS